MATSLSVGNAIYSLLSESAVAGMVTKIFPVVADSATLPYVAYRRSALEQTATKGPGHCDAVRVEVMACAAGYGESIELAEAVRGALDGARWAGGGLVVRSCTLVESEEQWQDDCFVQNMVYLIRV